MSSFFGNRIEGILDLVTAMQSPSMKGMTLWWRGRYALSLGHGFMLGLSLRIKQDRLHLSVEFQRPRSQLPSFRTLKLLIDNLMSSRSYLQMLRDEAKKNPVYREFLPSTPHGKVGAHPLGDTNTFMKKVRAVPVTYKLHS